MLIVGIDWSKSKHDAALMEPEGGVLEQLVVPHSREGLEALAQAIGHRERDPGEVRVAMEQHTGALLAWLLAQGYVVYGINPKSAQRARDRYRPAGGKDDRSDAYILADMLRQDRGYLRPLRPPNGTAAEFSIVNQAELPSATITQSASTTDGQATAIFRSGTEVGTARIRVTIPSVGASNDQTIIGVTAGPPALVTLAANQLPSHTHPMRASTDLVSETSPQAHVLGQTGNAIYIDDTPLVNMHTGYITSVGGGGSHPNVMPFLVINFIVALTGTFPSPP